MPLYSFRSPRPEEAPRKNEDAPAPKPPPFDAGPGMRAMQNAVAFNANSVLKPDAKLMRGMSQPLAEQAAAMMVEDVRSYLQGSESLLMAASAQALKLLMNEETQKTGAAALKEIAAAQTSLSSFAGNVQKQATEIAAAFDK